MRDRAAAQAGSWTVVRWGGRAATEPAQWSLLLEALRAELDDGGRVMVAVPGLRGVGWTIEALVDAAARGDPADPVDLRQRFEGLAGVLGLTLPQVAVAALDELNRLLRGIRLLGAVSPGVRARALTAGETALAGVLAAWLREAGIEAVHVPATQLLRVVDRRVGAWGTGTLEVERDAGVDSALAERLVTEGCVVVTEAGPAASADGVPVRLGAGEVDVAAAALAVHLGAKRLELWTGAPGLFSADPWRVPEARLVRELDYDEAQEMAASVAGLLHPRCIAPLRARGVPLRLRQASAPQRDGTWIGRGTASGVAQVKAICRRDAVTLVAMDTVGMWRQAGFLAEAFACFQRRGLSVDTVTTSETNVTVSLDPTPAAADEATLEALCEDLQKWCRARVIRPCTAVSIVGRQVRTALHRLAPALATFEERRLYLVSEAASDLSLTMVVDPDQADGLVARLHEALIRRGPAEPVFGPTWQALTEGRASAARAEPWWMRRRDKLLALAGETAPVYVYDLATIDERMAGLQGLTAVDRVLFSMKANPHRRILRRCAEAGLGIECVSPGELRRVRAAVPALAAERVLFTPNFADRREYAGALDAGVRVTLDNIYPVQAWPELFAGRELFVRVDPGAGRGHHENVRTAGAVSKFGIPLDELDELAERLVSVGAKVVGLHAHVGSGVTDPMSWAETGSALALAAERFPDVRVLDLGGGLGVPEKPGDPPLDLAALDRALKDLRARHPGYELWLEPGRYLVAEAGVLLARVTQLKGKGERRYLGLETGMNSLIRPMLYGAYHEIANLSRLESPAEELMTVVGPICETGDILGGERLLPESAPGDVCVIANVGAYGAAMASRYNLRAPARERVLEPE